LSDSLGENATLGDILIQGEPLYDRGENMKTRITLILAGLISLGAVSAQENYSLWGQHRSRYINTTLNGANIPQNVVGFPLLVRLDSSNFGSGFAQAKGNGADIRFTKAGDVVRLPHQIERWDSAGKKADIWVLVDTVKANSRTQFIRMHWSKADAADSSRGTAVFDTSRGFQAVWHLNELAADSARDATVNRFHAAPANSPGSAAGIVGLSRSFNGTSQHFEVPGSASGKLNFPLDGFYTLSAWAYIDAGSAAVDRVIAAKHDNQYALKISTDSRWQFFEYDGNWTIVGSAYETGRWTYLTGVMNGRDTYLYVDGVLAESNLDCCQGGGSRNETANFFIGRAGESARRWWWGTIDELNVANVARSANWTLLSYETQKPGSKVVSDTIQTATVPSAPNSVNAGRVFGNITSVIVSWAAAANGGEAITGYKAYAVSDPTKNCTTTELTCTITGLSVSTAYTIAVEATNSVGTGPAANSPAVSSLLPRGMTASSLGMHADAGYLAFNLPADAVSPGTTVTLSLFGSTGKKVWSRTVEAAAGANQVSWGSSASGIGPGVYIARMTLRNITGAATLSVDQKISVVR
jgi:hypothetical protein